MAKSSEIVGGVDGALLLRLALRATPRPRGAYGVRPCPVCGEPWRPWPFSRLRCHARCLLTTEGRVELVRRFRTERDSLRRLAEAFGVPRSVIRASLHAEGISMR